jgi:ABC-type cobalamin/Fe3+-siderophores transport system ATPase subunit
MSFPSKQFDLQLPTNGGVSFGLIGASRSGKTTLMKYLFRTFFKKHTTIMCTMNPHADIYSDLDARVLVVNDYHPELLREMHEMNSCCSNRYPFLFISDDFVNAKIKNDPEVTRALTIYRNANVSSIFSFQGRTLMNAVGRNNLNYIAILKQQTPKEFECVIKEYLSMWLPTGMTMKEQIEFCRLATEDHQFFFIDNIKGECYLTKLTKEQADV